MEQLRRVFWSSCIEVEELAVIETGLGYRRVLLRFADIVALHGRQYCLEKGSMAEMN